MSLFNVKHWLKIFSVTFCLSLASSHVAANIIIYQMDLDGLQEVLPTDLNGTATGIILFDDVTGLVAWELLYANIDVPLAMHIHGPGGFSGFNAAVIIGLGVSTSGGANSLIDNLIADLDKVNDILADPTGFYINIHTAEFTNGSVRGQLGSLRQIPAPSTLAMFLLAIMCLVIAHVKKQQ